LHLQSAAACDIIGRKLIREETTYDI